MTKSHIAIVFVVLTLLMAACAGQPAPAAEAEEPAATEESVAEEPAGEEAVVAEELVLVPTSAPEEETVAEDAAEEEAEAAAPTDTPVAEEEAVEEAVVDEKPTESEPVAEAADWTNSATADGDYYVRGNPNAPIRLIDYSDFL